MHLKIKKKLLSSPKIDINITNLKQKKAVLPLKKYSFHDFYLKLNNRLISISTQQTI